MSKTEQLLVDIHMPGVGLEDAGWDDRLQSWGRATLGAALVSAGEEAGEAVTVTYSRSKKEIVQAYDHGSRSATLQRAEEFAYADDGTATSVRLAAPQTVPFEEIGAIRNVTVALHYAALPEINNYLVRDLAKDKVDTNELLYAAGIYKEFGAYGPNDSLEAAFDMISPDQVVIKPRYGRGSQGVHIGTKAELQKKIASGEGPLPTDEWIVEEKLDLSAPMRLKGINEEQQAAIDAANKNGVGKELRAYTFGRDETGRLLTHYVLRIAAEHDGKLTDDWAFIDQQEIPDDVVSDVDKIAKLFEEETRIREMHLGIDMVYATDGSSLWLPMEVNGAEPQLVTESEQPEVARVHARLLSQQLIRVAQAGGTK